MSAHIKVPPVGESITEVVIGQWLVKEGATVQKEQPIVVLETDKVNVEVPAPQSGVLRQILKAQASTASVDEVIGIIEEGASHAVAAPVTHHPAPPQPVAAPPPAAPSPPATAAAASGGHVMPAAAHLAAQSHVDTNRVAGSGPGGRVLKQDVQAHVGAQAAPQPAAAPPAVPPPVAAAPAGANERVVPMTPMRRRIAQRLVEAQQTAAILTTFNEVDMTQVMALRKRVQEAFTKKHGVKLGFMSFFVKASVEALRAFPEINAEIRGTDVVYRDAYHIGVAVGGDKGLVVPVVRNAQNLSFAHIESTIGDFGARASAGKIKLDEMQGGSFTVSNGGVYGSLMSTPILNPPQSGILGMHGIVERPIAVEGQVVIRPMMYIALSYDHRIVDGRGAVSFLRRVKDCIEDPSRMLLEV